MKMMKAKTLRKCGRTSSKSTVNTDLPPRRLRFHTGNSVADETCARPRYLRSNDQASRTISWVLTETRPPTNNTEVHKGDMSYLIEATSNGLNAVSGHTLQFLDHIQVQFGLTPRQYLKWVAKFVRRGKYMMRKCLLCGSFFPSLDSGERHCKRCQPTRHYLVKEEGRSVFL
jgi:hypothetical protein